MGTRSLTCIIKNGKYQVAKYCQWDGYPSGQGSEILHFLKYLNLDRIQKNLDLVIPFNQETYNKGIVEFGFPKEELGKRLISMSSYRLLDEYEELHPEISRNTGAKILEILAKAEGPVEIKDDLEFAADSLSCEWCYIIDFDKMTFEVYKGFNKNPLSEEDRFFFLEEKSSGGYHPVRILKSYDLNHLPDRETFLAETKGNG